MNTEVQKWLLDAFNACSAISEFTHSKTFADYEGDLMLRSAVERQLEIVGEALNKAQTTDASLLNRIPDVRRIIGLRNRIIHGYDTVDNQIVWDIVITELPPLLLQISDQLNLN